MPLALAGRLLTTEPPEKTLHSFSYLKTVDNLKKVENNKKLSPVSSYQKWRQQFDIIFSQNNELEIHELELGSYFPFLTAYPVDRGLV